MELVGLELGTLGGMLTLRDASAADAHLYRMRLAWRKGSGATMLRLAGEGLGDAV